MQQFIPDYLLNSRHVYAVSTDLTGNYTFCNAYFLERFNFLEAELLGKPFGLSVFPGDVQRANDTAFFCMQNPGKVASVQLRKPADNKGNFYWTHWDFSLQLDAQNQPIGIICIGYDLTDKIILDEKSAFQEWLLKSVYDSSNEGYLLLSHEGIPLYVNKNGSLFFEKLFDVKPVESQSLPASFWTNSGDELHSFLLDAIKQNRVDVYTFGKAGAWYQCGVRPVKEQVSTMVSHVITLIDVTESKMKDLALKESQLSYGIMVNALSEGIVLHDPGDYGKVIECNEAACRILGLTRRQLMGVDSFDPRWGATDDLGKPLSAESYPSVVTSRTHLPVRNFIMGVNRGDRSKAWILVNSTPVFEEDEKTLKNVLVAFADITELVNLGIKLKHNEEQLQQIIEFLPNPLILLDKNYAITYANLKVEEIFAFDAEELKGLDIASFFGSFIKADLDSVSDLFEGALEASILRQNFSCFSRHGRKLFINLMVNKLETDAGTVHICIFQDVTTRTVYQQKVEQQNKVLSEIAWQQSHVLRKPVANIIGLCDMLRLQIDPSNDMEIALLDNLKVAAEELDTAIKTIVNQADT